jgi:hypothetical protein
VRTALPLALSLVLLLGLVGCGTFGLASDKLQEVDTSESSTSDTDADTEPGLDSGIARAEGTESGDCRDGADNDRDGLFDCDDPGCAGSPDCDGSGGDAGDGGAGGAGDGGGTSGSDGSGTGGSGSSGSGSSGSGTSGSGTSGSGTSGSGTSGSGSSGSGSSGSGTSGSGGTGTGGSGSTGGGTTGGGTGGSGSVCDTSCSWDGDGVCDDGGTDSVFSVCTFGSDCTDCGPRNPCLDTCTPWLTSAYAGDGTCDDGVSGSSGSSLCDAGTDCSDCGPRP